MRNAYAGNCYRCGLLVPEGAGYFEKIRREDWKPGMGKWRTQHCYRTHNGGITCEMAKSEAKKVALGDGGGKVSEPVRVQRKRTKGWKMPPNTVYVGRGSQWGNPYRVGTCLIGSNQDAVNTFAANLPLGNKFLEPLRGKNLACWCRLDQPCHADVLLEIANAAASKSGESV